jgi:hypothetical protein
LPVSVSSSTSGVLKGKGAKIKGVPRFSQNRKKNYLLIQGARDRPITIKINLRYSKIKINYRVYIFATNPPSLNPLTLWQYN